MTTSARQPVPREGRAAMPGAPPPPGALLAYVAAWVGVGLGTLCWTVLGHPGGGPRPAAWLVAALGVGAAVAGAVHVTVTIRGVREATTLSELAVVPLMVLLPPPVAVVTALVAGAVAEVGLTRGQLHKFAFNLAWQVTAVAAGAHVYDALGPPVFAPTPVGLAAATAAAATYLLVNVIALTGVLRIVTGRRLLVLVPEDAPSGLLVNAGAAVVGVLVATLVAAAPAALPLVAVLPLIDSDRLRARSIGYGQLADERDRFVRTVDGSSDGVILLDRAGHVEVWNPAAARLTGVPAADALGATLGELALEGLNPSPRGHRAARTLLRDTVVDVTRSNGHGGTVLTLRDVSHEAEMARIRDDLVQRVSHEIRTPVTTVAGCLQTLQVHWDALPDERRRELVLAGSRGADRLGTMVANLLALSRVETPAGVATPDQPWQCDVAQVVDEVVEDLGLVGVTVRVCGRPSAAVHARDLRLIVRNLLENAARYGAPPVRVEVRREGPRVLLRVRDHGPGMPDDTTRGMFRAFAQGDDGLRRTSQGIGVGLAVVASLVAAAGGHVTTRDVTPGACVEISLPASQRQLPGDDLLRDDLHAGPGPSRVSSQALEG